jgi:hypothetical protein
MSAWSDQAPESGNSSIPEPLCVATRAAAIVARSRGGSQVDTTGGEEQSYFEDCPVCCRPAEIFVRCRAGEILSISVTAD